MGEPQQQQLPLQQQQQQPTFSWTGAGRQEGSRIYYSSFNFSGELYTLGDCVYLLPEEEGAPPYIAKLMRAWEDAAAADAEKLIIEVRWYERRSAVPAALAAGMHEHEVVASDLLDTNLVGCLDTRATVVRANSYQEACELVAAVAPQAGRSGEWHFCRGVLDSASQTFRTFQELGIGPLDDEFGAKPDAGLLLGGTTAAQPVTRQGFAGSTSYCNGTDVQQQQHEDTEMLDVLGPSCRGSSGKSSGGANSNRGRRVGGVAGAAAAPAAAGSVGTAGGGSGSRGIPGKVCCECGATQTPQWREGPQGPKTLCNACGVRYQRSQSKAKSNKRQASDRARAERGSPMTARAPKQACLASRAAAAAADAGKAAAGHGHGTRSAIKGASRQASQQQHASRQHNAAAAPHGSHDAQQQQQQQQQRADALRAAAAAGRGLYGAPFYEDEGSPPGTHTHILEEAAEEDEQQQSLARPVALNRSATHDAADVLQTLALPQQHRGHHHQQQQQQHAMHLSAGYCSMGIGSPSSSMLLVDQLQPDAMPLLSLNDSSLTGVGPDGVLMGGPDSLDPSLNPSFPNPGLQPHSLSPLPRSHRLSAAAAGGSRLRTPGTSGASAVCASPGRLIAAMVQGLKLPTPLSLNGPAGLPGHQAASAAASDEPAASAAAPIGLDLSTHPQQQQQQQPASSMVSSSMLSSQGHSQQLSLGMQHQPLQLHGVPGKGPLLPLIGSSSNISAQMHAGGGSTAATAGGVGPGSDSAPASAAASSCETPGPPGAAAAGRLAGVSSSFVPKTAAAAAAAAGGTGSNGSSCPLLSQLRSLVFRASAFTPDVQGLSALCPGASSPCVMQQLAQQLDQLPEASRLQLQQVSVTVDEQLSKAKAADAAVLAVTQVLAAKKQAAAEARQEVASAVLLLRSLLCQVSPGAAAAAAGSCCCSCDACCSGTRKHSAACSPGACTTAGGTGCCGAGSSSGTACTTAAAAAAGGGDSGCCVVGSSRLGGNSPRVLVSQGLPHPTQGFDLSTGDVTRLRCGLYDAPGAGIGLQGFAGDGSDADDLIRDPEEQQQQQQQQQQAAGKGHVAGAAVLQVGRQAPAAADVKPEPDGHYQQQQGVC